MARPREFDEDTVLRAAAGVFRRHGYAGASLEDLTEATGLGKGSLYGAFGSKHGLYLAALDAYASRGATGLERTFDASASLADVRDYLVEIAVASSDGSPSCLLTGATAERAGNDEPVARRVADTFAGLAASFQVAVRAAQERGEVPADAAPEVLADLLLTLARGMEVLGHAGVTGERLVAAADAAVAAIAA